jgi:hypothetical protein
MFFFFFVLFLASIEWHIFTKFERAPPIPLGTYLWTLMTMLISQ